MGFRISVGVGLVLAAVGCVGADGREVDGAAAQLPVTEPTWESWGMLRAVEVEPLDTIAATLGLTPESAALLDRHRRGTDRLAGTDDDGRFASLAELVEKMRIKPDRLLALRELAIQKGHVVEHPFPPQLIGRVLRATGEPKECSTHSWTTRPNSDVETSSTDVRAPADVRFRLLYAGPSLVAELLDAHLPGPAWVDRIAKRPAVRRVTFRATEPGTHMFDGPDFFMLSASMDFTGVQIGLDVQCQESGTCRDAGSETECHAGFRLDMTTAASVCQADPNGTPAQAVPLPASYDPVELNPLDYAVQGTLVGSGDVDWYTMKFDHHRDRCVGCFLPRAALRVESEPRPLGAFEVCVFVDAAEAQRRGPSRCIGGVGVVEGGLAGCCGQVPGGDAEGAALDVGEVMMQNAWEQGPDDPAAMLLRVRTTLPEADAACVPYEIVYGHFSG